MDKGQLLKRLKETGYLKSKKVEKAFRKVPRENFVLPEYKDQAYANTPLPILKGQTISQPLTVVAMTEALDIKKSHKILEIGTGSGYQAAILSELCSHVITIERIKELYEYAKRNLEEYENVTLIQGDGKQGYPQKAPYNRIIVTASAKQTPPALLEQLSKGSKMIIPVGDNMLLYQKNGQLEKTFIGYYSFVPLK